MVLEYEGTAYAGFQRQANAPSVQATIEEAIAALTGEQARLHGAGRTDAGVHALGQVAAFDTTGGLPPGRLRDGLNHYLPPDAAVVEAYETAPDFDPRRHALSRVYRYSLLTRRARSPLRRRFTHAVSGPPDAAAMAAVLATLQGEHDFAPFCGRYPEGKPTRRRILRTAVWREGAEVHIEIEGNAFLPQQVRRMAAAVLEVGLGERTSREFEELAKSGRRGAAEAALPPQGLTLRQVKYADFPPQGYATATDNTAHAKSTSRA